MSISPKLPPSARDFLAYERHVIDEIGTRAVAAELRISQTRVRQVIHRVTRWLVENLPAESDSSQAALIRFGHQLAADRLERIYFEASRDWHETKHTKFANLCIRILEAKSKFPAIPGALESLFLDATLGPLPDDTNELYTASSLPPQNPQSPIPNPKTEIPPTRACSPSPQFAPPATEKPATASAPTPRAPKTCNNPPPPARSTRTAFLAPAHSPAIADDAPVTELKITPEKLGLTTHQHSSRKDRRRLCLALTKK